MRFVVDSMLGGLARWLRMLGHTVFYDSQASDNGLLSQAANEKLVLLTRDEELYRRAQARKISTLLVLGENEEQRLAQIARTYHISLKMDMAETKCPECGGNLRLASKEKVVDKIPAASLKLYSEFWECVSPICGKVYWMGSHWKQINQMLAETRTLAGEDA